MVNQGRLISKRLFIWLYMVVSLMVLITGYIYYVNAVKTIKTEKHTELHAIAGLKADQIANWMLERRGNAVSVVTSPLFIKAIDKWIGNGSDPVLRDEIITRLNTVREQYNYTNILLTTPAGKILMAAEREAATGIDQTTAANIQHSVKAGSIFFSDFYINQADRKIYLDFIIPVWSLNHRLIAIMIFRIAPEKFLYPLIQSWPVPVKSAETLIVRQEGDSVLFLNNLLYNPEAAMRLRVAMTDTLVPAVQAVRGRSGIYEGRDYRNIPVLAHLDAIPETSWFMVAKIDRQEIYAGVYRELKIVLLIVIILLVTIAAGMAFIYKQRQKAVIQALYTAEKRRQEIKEEYHTALTSIGDAVMTTDRSGLIQFMNPGAERLTGWTLKEARGLNLPEVFKIVNEDTRQTVPDPVKRVLHEGLIVGLANHTLLIARDGKEIPVADSGAPIKNENGEIIGTVLVFRDQTAERAVQDKIISSEKQFRTIWESSRDGMRLCDSEGVIKMVNPAYCIMAGKLESELIGRPIAVVYSPDTAEQVMNQALERFRKGMPEAHFEQQLTMHDDRTVWFEISYSQIELNGQKLNLSIFRDTTFRKLAELDVRKSEERFRSTLDNMLEGAQIIDYEWRYIYLNTTAVVQSRSTREKLMNKAYTKVWPGIEDTELYRTMNNCMTHQVAEHFENEFIYPDDVSGWFELSIQPVPEGLFILSIDISERKKIEEQIRRSERQFRSVWEESPEGMRLTDENGTVVRANEAYCKIMGLERSAIEGHSLAAVYAPERREHIEKKHRERFMTRTVKRFSEQEVILNDGRRIWLAVTNSFFESDNHKLLLLGTFRDITELKQAELEILKVNRIYVVISQINQVIVREKDRSKLFKEVCRIAIDYGNFRMAWIGLIDENGEKVVPVEYAGYDDGYLNLLKYIPIGTSLEGSGPTGLAVREGKYVCCNDIANDPKMESWRAAAIERGYHSSIALPIKLHEKIIGTFNIYASEQNFFDKSEIDLLIEVANDISFALEAIERESIRQKAEEELRKSEEKHRDLLENMQEGFFIADEEGRIQYVNRELARIHGFNSPDEMIGRNFLDFVEPSVREKYLQSYQQDISATQVQSPVMPIVRQDGSLAYVLVRPSPIMDGERVIGLTGLVQDITESMRAEEEIRMNVTRLRELVDILQHTSGSIQEFLDYALDKAIKLTGSKIGYIYHYHADRQEFVLNSWSKEVMAECSIDNPHTCYELNKTGLWGEVIRQKKPIIVNDFPANNPLKKGYPKGHAKLLKYMSVPIFKDDDIVGVIGLANKNTDYTETDVLQASLLMEAVWKVTERKQAEEALQISESQLRQNQKLEAIGQLASGIAHDFNNILSIILGNVTLLKMSQHADEKCLKNLNTIEKTGKRGTDLVKQLLTLARRSEPSIGPVNVAEIIKETIQMLKETFPKIISFNVNIDRSLPFILADSSQMNQVLMNLCVNARDALLPKGGSIGIKASPVSGQVVRQSHPDAIASQYIAMCVSDDGIGMDQATIEHIFEPFFTTKERGQGTGLGMPTVYGIVVNHHGFIDIKSQPGAGTEVTVYLPAPAGSEITITGEVEEPGNITGGKETILVIEDEELLIEMFKSVFTKYGYTVLDAKDGIEGLDIYKRKKKKIDLIISDLGLPRMTGDAVFQQIREIDPEVKFIMISGFINPDDKSELLKKGMSRFLQKPILPLDALKVIREVLNEGK